MLIYIDARRGHTIQDLALRHHVPRRLVRLALDTMQPPPRGVERSHSHLDSDLMESIQAMLDQGLGPKQIWLNLMDNHDLSVSYTLLRHYVRYRFPQRYAAQWQP
ncbi:hypothetical protein ACH4KC_31775 [Streptomyces griseoaurantiacus]|uniref:hypothetical protein n=1 Tax=Streptomyces griseoaurantiacus TaxID=68213 RepID=UPI00379CA481